MLYSNKETLSKPSYTVNLYRIRLGPRDVATYKEGPGVGVDLQLEARFGLDKARLGLDSARRLGKPSLNLATEARGSTSQLGEARKPARRLDVIKKIAITFTKIVRFHKLA
jgi:hypothetical protein